MNILVLTSEPVSAARVSDALGESIDPSDTQVMVVAPALHESPVTFWLSDADEAIARAKKVGAKTLAELDDAGVPAAADTGEGDPTRAIEDALRTFPADQIVVFRHTGDEERYREDVDTGELEERFGLPVSMASV